MIKRVKCVISGRVQGVLYRLAVKQWAIKCGVYGTVRNLSDGTVEAVSEAAEEKLNAFLCGLWKGSAFSKVRDVNVTWQEATGEFQDFKVIHGRF